MPSLNPRWIVGKRVKAVHNEKHEFESLGQTIVITTQIDFEDGSSLRFQGLEDETDIYTRILYLPPEKKP